MKERRLPASMLFEALGGIEGVGRLTQAWHERAMADEVVSHAFSHGFDPRRIERLAAYWAEAWGASDLQRTVWHGVVRRAWVGLEE